MASKWTDEKVELLKKLWLSGFTARQIAERFGDVTRNAVIGKANRLGLSSHVHAVAKRETRQVGMIALAEHGCQWPDGQPGEEGFGFCGEKVRSGYSYCEKHCAVAYRRASRSRGVA